METTDNVIPTPERPQALKTLCILSFIGCGLMLCLSLLSIPKILKSNEAKAREVEQTRQFNEGLADALEAQYMDPAYTSKAVTSLAINTVFLLVTFTGVLMMWRLKKTGFYIYAASEVLFYFAKFIPGQEDGSQFMSHASGLVKTLAMVGFALTIAQDIVFIILYWRQTKYMK